MILITGHKGFIGKHLTANLDKDNIKWVGFDLLDGQDIRNKLDLERVFDTYPIDTVIHMAALAGARRGDTYPQDYFDTNVIGTENVARTCEKYGIQKLIAFSSSSAKVCQNTYGVTKFAMELMLRKIRLPQIFIIRPFNVYGENGRPDQVIYKWKTRIEAGLPIEYHGDLKRNYTYVGDIIDGLRTVLNATDKDGHILDFGNHEKVGLGELLELFKKKYPDMKVTDNPMPDVDVSPDGEFPCKTRFIKKAKDLI